MTVCWGCFRQPLDSGLSHLCRSCVMAYVSCPNQCSAGCECLATVAGIPEVLQEVEG